MIDWELDDEHTAIQDAAHKFAQSEIAPLARDVDLEERGFPEDLLTKMAAQGYFGMGIGVEQGGLGSGTLAMGLVTEEFCRASLAMGSIVQRNWLCGHILDNFGTSEQKNDGCQACPVVPFNLRLLEPSQTPDRMQPTSKHALSLTAIAMWLTGPNNGLPLRAVQTFYLSMCAPATNTSTRASAC
jgi:hypothetical protein